MIQVSENAKKKAIELMHEMVRPIHYATDADIIALSFMDYCAPHAFAVAERFRRRGKVVMIGGPQASLRPDVVRPHCDILVRGEVEAIADAFVPGGEVAAGEVLLRIDDADSNFVITSD